MLLVIINPRSYVPSEEAIFASVHRVARDSFTAKLKLKQQYHSSKPFSLGFSIRYAHPATPTSKQNPFAILRPIRLALHQHADDTSFALEFKRQREYPATQSLPTPSHSVLYVTNHRHASTPTPTPTPPLPLPVSSPPHLQQRRSQFLLPSPHDR